MTDLTGKTAVVTGASRSIGAATARHLAALGAHVVLAARSASEIEAVAADIAAAGGSADAVPTDVARWPDVEALIARARAARGTLDVLVNNAGLIDPISRLADSDPAEWATVIQVNLLGVYHGLRAAIPAMLAQGGGTVVTVSSGAATGALEGWSHYCASKAGALSLTRVAHAEYGAEGVRVLGLSPGTVATHMQTAIRASGLNPVSRLDPDAHIPPEDAARAIAFLCGPGGDPWLGDDFPLRPAENRRLVGLDA